MRVGNYKRHIPFLIKQQEAELSSATPRKIPPFLFSTILKVTVMVKNYKKFYEQKTGIKIPFGFDIHHLNCFKTDISFENLLMLPNELHSKLHELMPYIDNQRFHLELLSHDEAGHHHNEFLYDKIKAYMKIYRKCCMWKDYKQFIMGKLPNIHNITICQ